AGWYWFLVSGAIALGAAVLLVMKLPYSHSFTPATVAGVSLLFAGWAYVAMALAARTGERASAA
ncbi:MAG TPA: HdeD family acid-resistance protein, partial [Reyranella sp.]|nr:HdeD family acid-resistance protein [Reyranella sp.]